MKFKYKKYTIYSKCKDLIIKNFNNIINQDSGYFILESDKKYLILLSKELKYIRLLVSFSNDFYIDYIDNDFKKIEILLLSDLKNFSYFVDLEKTKYDRKIKNSLKNRDTLDLDIIKVK